jgi:glycosyltransferase involved in cell wall biosynthesis
MSAGPLVSVITPTWQRRHVLLARCIPSVQAQTYPHVEHVIVSDGPDEDLAMSLAKLPVVYGEVPVHDPHPSNWGSEARNVGLKLASGELVAYLDDDNSWRPDHVERLVEAMTASPDTDFGYSRMQVSPGGHEIGSAPPAYGQLDSSCLFHRRGLPERVGLWPPPGQIVGFDQHAPDWGVVALWLAGGARWVFVPEVTVDYFPSR